MKLNPCKKCGEQPYFTSNLELHSLTCKCQFSTQLFDTSIEALSLGWNAMNPERKTATEAREEWRESLRASDCPVESQEPEEQFCKTCFYFRNNAICKRFPPVIEGQGDLDFQPAVSPSGWCGEWRAK